MKLRIERTGGDVDEFDVPEYAGMTVLDAIMYVREHHDPSIAVRFACRCANACKECVTVIDGRRDYACTVAAAGEVQVGPLPNKRLIHDLAVEL